MKKSEQKSIFYIHLRIHINAISNGGILNDVLCDRSIAKSLNFLAKEIQLISDSEYKYNDAKIDQAMEYYLHPETKKYYHA